jgi:hypothetical protein
MVSLLAFMDGFSVGLPDMSCSIAYLPETGENR